MTPEKSTEMHLHIQKAIHTYMTDRYLTRHSGTDEQINMEVHIKGLNFSFPRTQLQKNCTNIIVKGTLCITVMEYMVYQFSFVFTIEVTFKELTLTHIYKNSSFSCR